MKVHPQAWICDTQPTRTIPVHWLSLRSVKSLTVSFIRQRFPHICIVALTSHETETTREEIQEAGAHEFLIEDTSGDTLASVTKAVCRDNPGVA